MKQFKFQIVYLTYRTLTYKFSLSYPGGTIKGGLAHRSHYVKKICIQVDIAKIVPTQIIK